LKLIAGYMRDVILFEQMASRETNQDLKEALESRLRPIANCDGRVKELGLNSFGTTPSR
jgi:hypothetical protein